MARNRETIRDLKKSISAGKAATLSGDMRRLIKKCANKRGQDTEKRVEEALEALKREGRIASFYMTKKWSRQDRRGIDAVVFLNERKEVRCQIKSSLAGIEKHEEQQKEFGGEEIKAFHGNYLAGETFEEYKERIFRNITEGLC